jgi:hypothetical protein
MSSFHEDHETKRRNRWIKNKTHIYNFTEKTSLVCAWYIKTRNSEKQHEHVKGVDFMTRTTLDFCKAVMDFWGAKKYEIN